LSRQSARDPSRNRDSFAAMTNPCATEHLQQIRIRPAREDEAEQLRSVERIASQRFRAIGLDRLSDIEPIGKAVFEQAAREKRLLVADILTKTPPPGTAAGFALFGFLDKQPHILELDVLPEHAGQRVGKRLIDAVVEATAAHEDRIWITLTTFRDVPWNAPYYRRLGFEVIDDKDLGEALAACLERERKSLTARGFGARVAMRRRLRKLCP